MAASAIPTLDNTAAATPRLLIRQVTLLISQLTFISEGRSTIRHLWVVVQLCLLLLNTLRYKEG